MESRQALSMSIEFDDEGVYVVAQGELDRSTASTFGNQLAQLIEMGHSPIMVDLSQIGFADVTGYRATTRFGERCAQNGLLYVWICPSPPVKLLWRILGEPPGTVQPTRRRDPDARSPLLLPQPSSVR
jgi:anti-anti-sigma factor